MGVSKNRGTPNWMVYNGKPYWNGWFGGTTFSETSKYRTLKNTPQLLRSCHLVPPGTWCIIYWSPKKLKEKSEILTDPDRFERTHLGVVLLSKKSLDLPMQGLNLYDAGVFVLVLKKNSHFWGVRILFLGEIKHTFLERVLLEELILSDRKINDKNLGMLPLRMMQSSSAGIFSTPKKVIWPLESPPWMSRCTVFPIFRKRGFSSDRPSPVRNFRGVFL